MARKKNRLSISGEDSVDNKPFASLSIDGLISGVTSAPVPEYEKKTSRGRLDVKREKSGRGGKTVTVIYGMQSIEMRERVRLLKKMKSSCGVGGTIKGANLEVQGDNRDAVQRILEEDGFHVVLAGG